MSTNDISSLPPATLRAALEISENRVRREKEKIKRDIRKMEKRLDELDRGPGVSELESEENVASGSQRKRERLRVDSPSDDEVISEWYDRQWPIAKARKLDLEHKGPSCSRCQKKGVRCEWDENSTSRSRICLACKHSRQECDLKRPATTGHGAQFTQKKSF